MTLANQWTTVKNNWLLIALVLVVIALFNFGSLGSVSLSSVKSMGEADYAYESYGGGTAGRSIAPSPGNPSSFAPDVVDRKITKSASMTTEVERGTFPAAQAQFKSVLAGADGILLNENVANHGNDRDSYLQGWYQLKVPVSRYDAAVTQLKAIGEVQSFSEDTEDITETYVNLQAQLDAERTRLVRYQEMYAESTKVEDKLQVSDRIFNQEQQIKYLEDALTNTNQRIDYSTIQLTITEERSAYAGIALVKLSGLVRNLVGSVNALLSFIVAILPWAVGAGIVLFIWKRLHRA